MIMEIFMSMGMENFCGGMDLCVCVGHGIFLEMEFFFWHGIFFFFFKCNFFFFFFLLGFWNKYFGAWCFVDISMIG